MDDRHFDALTRWLAAGTTRRTWLKGLVGASLAAVLGRSGVAIAVPRCRGEGHPCDGWQTCCDGLVCMAGSHGRAARCTSCPAGTVFFQGTCCAPENAAATCAGKCGTQTNDCGQSVACGHCCTPDCAGKQCGGDGCGDSCGTCANGNTCSEGVCGCGGNAACTGSEVCCDSYGVITCTSMQSDVRNCGACQAVCAGGASCESGVCKCPSGETCFNGGPGTAFACNPDGCTDLETDPDNCGCGGCRCPSGACVTGRCTCTDSTQCFGGGTCITGLCQ